MNAVRQAFAAILLFVSYFSPPTNPKNMGMFVIGFITAKNPVNTDIENNKIVSDINSFL
jgi:hypothetical protein